MVAARSLDDGVAWCEATLGIMPGPGGKHPLMSTHNRLFSIGGTTFPRTFFEIIAIDAQAPAPGRARWFGMDALDLSGGPQLVNVVARTPALDALLAALQRGGFDGSRALAASRQASNGLLQWRIAVRDDGTLGSGGAMPTLIEWGERHPADTMPPSGVTLRSLALRGVPSTIADALAWRDVHWLDTPGPSIEALLDTPHGPVTLTSH